MKFSKVAPNICKEIFKCRANFTHCGKTDRLSEKITFPQFCWRVVINKIQQECEIHMEISFLKRKKLHWNIANDNYQVTTNYLLLCL